MQDKVMYRVLPLTGQNCLVSSSPPRQDRIPGQPHCPVLFKSLIPARICFHSLDNLRSL